LEALLTCLELNCIAGRLKFHASQLRHDEIDRDATGLQENLTLPYPFFVSTNAHSKIQPFRHIAQLIVGNP
jgi:hypothetical protein